MARAARTIGDGGALGWLVVETQTFPDESQPTISATTVQYRVSGESQDQSVNFVWNTTWTAAEIRSGMKDAIKQNILDVFAVVIPKSAIKVQAPE